MTLGQVGLSCDRVRHMSSSRLFHMLVPKSAEVRAYLMTATELATSVLLEYIEFMFYELWLFLALEGICSGVWRIRPHEHLFSSGSRWLCRRARKQG